MNWPLFGEISGGIMAGLFLVPFSMATIRAMIGVKKQPWVEGDVQSAMARAGAEGWLYRSFGAFDIAFNVIALRGQQDETISTHAYRASLQGKWWGIRMTQWLSWFQPNHGPLAASGDLVRASVRVEILKKILGVA